MKNGPVCAHHAGIGVQSYHKVFSTKCTICENDDPCRLIDMDCGKSSRQIIYNTHAYLALGHTVCRECLREWAANKHNTTVTRLQLDDVFLVPCASCRDTVEFGDLITRPSLEHKPGGRRWNTYSFTARHERRA